MQEKTIAGARSAYRVWEPAFLVDVTRHSLCFVCINLDLARHEQGKNAFYHVHVYRYPILSVVGVGFICAGERAHCA